MNNPTTLRLLAAILVLLLVGWRIKLYREQARLMTPPAKTGVKPRK